MTASASVSPIEEANIRKMKAIERLEQAHALLRDAQNHITDVEGNESAAIYDGIADAYQSVAALRDKTRRMKATGLFA